ncbi:LysR substrate-binding domain-containing protein [Pendulispora albinea]|uniref:LysR substrate-binding domain-containing protein n=1 Tax=Pendulispora albinea TaxID=2741071 RepID=A0ABZ2M7U0_9BACT
MLDLNQALTFAMVARHGSFAAAARALEIPRSTVSARIAALEEHLGVRLLRRTTRHMALTDEGRAYHATIADAVDTLLGAGAGAAGRERGLSGTIRLTAPVEYPQTILSRAIRAFRRRHPRVRFDVLLSNRTLDFVADNIDIAIRGSAPGGPGRIATKLGVIPFGLFASPRYLAVRGRPARLADLREHDLLPFVGRDGLRLLGLSSSALRADRASGTKSDAHRPSEAPVSSDSMTFLKRLAKGGAGIAILPLHLCTASLRRGTLVHLLPEWSGSEISSTFLVFPSRRDISPRVRAFAACLREVATAFAPPAFAPPA